MTSNYYLRPLVLLTALLASGCASKPVMLPMTIQSDPLGAYVLMQHRNPQMTEPEWLYLGNTPLSSQRKVNTDQSLVLRVMKEGFFDQTRQWQSDQIKGELENKNRVFWNPRLVPSAAK